MQEQQAELCFTRRQAAKLLRVDLGDVQRAIDAGAIPTFDHDRLKFMHVLAIDIARRVMGSGSTLGAAKQAGEFILSHSETDLREAVDRGRKYLLGVCDEFLPLLLNESDLRDNPHLDIAQALAVGVVPIVVPVGAILHNLSVRALRITRQRQRDRAQKVIRTMVAAGAAAE